MLTSALEHYRRQQRLTAGVLAATRRRGGDPVRVAQLVAAYQLLAATDATASVQDMLDEQGVSEPPTATVITAAVVGVASDGRPLVSLFEQAQSPGQLALMVATQVQDAARTAASLSIATRTNVGYVRMLNPPSCSRCAVLAGRFYKWNFGFQRHPRCDCRHIPSPEVVHYDTNFSADKYFHSLSAPDQDRIFTKAGAQAIRDGADVAQVVNARSGMSTAQVVDRRLKVTTVGTTRRGGFGRSQFAADAGFNAESLGRRGSVANYVQRTTKRQRLMPESIYEISGSREEAQRLLKLYGYIV